MGLSSPAFRIGKSWLAFGSINVLQLEFWASSCSEAFMSFTSRLPQIANIGKRTD